MDKVDVIGNLYQGNEHQSGSVYGTTGVSPTLNAGCHSYGIPFVVDQQNSEQMIVAMRGRNPDNPSDRTPGVHVEQRLEPNVNGVCNTLTSVQKDNLVMETSKIVAIDEQNMCVRQESFGCLTTDGSSPKHNNRVCEIGKVADVPNKKKVKIRQATKDGFIDCEIGGGIGFGVSEFTDETRTRSGRRTDLPDLDDGGYP